MICLYLRAVSFNRSKKYEASKFHYTQLIEVAAIQLTDGYESYSLFGPQLPYMYICTSTKYFNEI